MLAPGMSARRTRTRGRRGAALAAALGPVLASLVVFVTGASVRAAPAPDPAAPQPAPEPLGPALTARPAPGGSSVLSEQPGEAPARPPARRRRWALGLEGVGLQIPPLRPRVADLDPRYLGGSVTLGGVGAVGRVRVVPEIAIELAVRSGSVRYRSAGDLVSQDVLLAEIGALVFLARGEVGQFAFDAGVGGLAHSIRYELGSGQSGAQLAPAFSVRVGADLELLLGRFALTFSLRAHGVVTDAARTRATGPLFSGADESLRRAPLPRFQTYLLGSAGLLYRF
jgi:hypothetical protein